MTIFDEIEQCGLQLTDRTRALFDEARLGWFHEFLCAENRRGGFFSEADGDRVLERHIYESLIFVARLRDLIGVSGADRVADVGTGPGLPGFLFACLTAPPHVSLIDSSRRRLGMLEEAVTQAGEVASVEFLYERAEVCCGRDDFEPYALVTARALIPYPHVVEVVGELVSPGAALALAGTDSSATTSADAGYLEALGFEEQETIVPPELSFLGERCFRILRRVSAAAPGYPRRWPRIRRDIERRREHR